MLFSDVSGADDHETHKNAGKNAADIQRDISEAKEHADNFGSLVTNIAHFGRERRDMTAEVLQLFNKYHEKHLKLATASDVKRNGNDYARQDGVCLLGKSGLCQIGAPGGTIDAPVGDKLIAPEKFPNLRNFIHRIPEDMVLSSSLITTDGGSAWQYPKSLRDGLFGRPTQYSMLIPFMGTGTVNVAGQTVAIKEGEVGIANLADYPYKLEGHGVIWYVVNMLADEIFDAPYNHDVNPITGIRLN